MAMASACVNNIPMPSWLNPSDPDPQQPDFEFPLERPVAMLSADQLFSDGKLLPLHLKPSSSSSAAASVGDASHSPTTASSGTDPYLFSPKAPRCSSRWKELLGLRKLYQTTNSNSNSNSSPKTTPSPSNKSLKHFLHRGTSKTASLDAASLSQPLLKDSDSESVSISSRLSLSSSSSSHELDDLPRLSLDSDKPNPNQNPNPIQLHRNPKMRNVKPRAGSFDQHPTGNRVGRSPIRREPSSSGTVACRGVSVDSPRMNSSGKIVFQSLERSSSSPSSFNGGPRFKHRGMERSYSANVRVTPVLNVPVCSLRGGSKSGSVFGFGQLFSSPQKKETSNKNHHQRNRCDRN